MKGHPFGEVFGALKCRELFAIASEKFIHLQVQVFWSLVFRMQDMYMICLIGEEISIHLHFILQSTVFSANVNPTSV